MYGSASPYGRRPGRGRPWQAVVVVLVVFVLVVFAVDKLVLQSPDDAKLAPGLTAALAAHNIRHVTIPARSVTVELNDGKTRTYAVPADVDLWPAIRRSGADVTISRAPER